jgi:hypothetical protein
VSSTAPRGLDPNVKRAIIGLGVVVVVVALVLELHRLQRPSRGADPHTDIPQLSAVKTYDYAGGDHTGNPVTYTETPPAGGPHNPQWEDCGAYTQQIANENAVHSLEHGTVWITYRPGLPAADVQTLQTALGTVKSKKTILSPYPGLPSPVVVTVWNAQLDLRSASDPRLPIFLGFYGDGHTSPEGASTSCAGGLHNYATPGGL